MIAEAIKLVRRLTSPLKRTYWWPGRAKKNWDCSGVLLVSLAEIDEEVRLKLLSYYSSYHRQPLSDSTRPRDSEPDRKDSWLAVCYRLTIFIVRTLRHFRSLGSGKCYWAQHLCECQAIARAHQALMLGQPYHHLGALSGKRYSDLKSLDRLISDIEHRRYEIWLIFRSRKEAYVPSSLAWPDVPLSVQEIEELAYYRSRPSKRVQGLKHLRIPPGRIRLMTYNVHSCIGLDGRLSIRRIAEVLDRYSPHFVALQELDRFCRRTELKDQLAELSKLWPSTAFFFSAMRKDGGEYGIGCLSRLTVTEARGHHFSNGIKQGLKEPRVATVTRVVCPNGTKIGIINTHLGLTKRERLAQIEGIENIIDSLPEPSILMGDLNCAPTSEEIKRLQKRMKKTSEKLARTWFGSYPLRTLDYVLVSKELSQSKWASFVPIEPLTIKASDHLPVVVDIEIP